MALLFERGFGTDLYTRVTSLAEAKAVESPLFVREALNESNATDVHRRWARYGIETPCDADLVMLAPWLKTASLFAINFASFSDGRGYSLARMARDRLGFKGELRAKGDVLRDQLFYLKRCGFSSFEVPQESAELARAFSDFSVTYQGAADDPRPLFVRIDR